MTPGNIKGATRALGKPTNWDDKDGECATLYVRDHRGAGPTIMQSAWYPSPEEIEQMIKGEPVILSIWGPSHPPVSLEVPGNELNQGRTQ